MRGTTFVDFDICHRILIAKIVLHDLDIVFEGQQFETSNFDLCQQMTPLRKLYAKDTMRKM